MSWLPAGSTREAAFATTCAAEPCDEDAAVDALHRPGENESVWVPLCMSHLNSVGREVLEYRLETHGFVYPVSV